MTKLVTVNYDIPTSMPVIWVDALKKLPRFHTLVMELGGVESLPTVLPLAPRLKGLCIKAYRHAVPFPSLIQLCPITVAPQRRSRLPPNNENVATVDEHISAWDQGVAKLLIAAKDNLVWLTLSPALAANDPMTTNEEQYPSRLFVEMKRFSNTGSVPKFPRLERLGLNASTHEPLIQHFLATSLNLTTMDTSGPDLLKAPPRKLTTLRNL